MRTEPVNGSVKRSDDALRCDGREKELCQESAIFPIQSGRDGTVPHQAEVPPKSPLKAERIYFFSHEKPAAIP